METRVISTNTEYEAALTEIDRLILNDPAKNSPEGRRLEVLAVLVEAYERARFRVEKPTPVEAIRFRMEEGGLQQRDLIPFIGSKSKVSEVLGGKARLSLRSIRNLSSGLGIPAEVLIQDIESSTAGGRDGDAEGVDWTKFPVREMVRLKWISATAKEIRSDPGAIAIRFFGSLGPSLPARVFCRRAIQGRGRSGDDRFPLLAWTARLLICARSIPGVPQYIPGTVNEEFIRTVVELSPHADGPVRAMTLLRSVGVVMVVIPQLPRMRLDGGCTLSEDGRPVVGLTLRYDRIDNFWYTLLHELAHIARHLSSAATLFADDLDTAEDSDPVEQEADELARECSLPRAILRRHDAFLRRNAESVVSLAQTLRIHPAIVAGRIRRETNDYRLFNQLVGHRQVRALFDASRMNETKPARGSR